MMALMVYLLDRDGDFEKQTPVVAAKKDLTIYACIRQLRALPLVLPPQM